MPNKRQLLAIAKELGLDVDLKWTKREMEEAIATAEAEIEALEAEKATEEEPEPEAEPATEEPVDPEPTPEPTPAPEPVEPPKAAEKAPSPVTPPKPSPPTPEPKALPGTYKCLTGLTWQGNVYDIGDTVVMDDESAKVHVRDKAIGPVDAVQAKAERAKMLPAGEYKLIYGLTLNGQVHDKDSTVDLTEEQANLYEKIGAIGPR